MSWDIALSEMESGDYSACVVLLVRKEVFYILGKRGLKTALHCLS
jgi:phage terminase large subunit-like protein